MITIDIDQQLHFLWERWCKQAADKSGLSVDELKRQLEADEAYLEITVRDAIGRKWRLPQLKGD